MNQKLTLSIEQSAIKRGKQYAQKQGRSLSSMVEDFLLLLGSEGASDEQIELARRHRSWTDKRRRLSRSSHRKG